MNDEATNTAVTNIDVASTESAVSKTLVLGPLLRHVDETSATIWVEISAPGVVEVLDSQASTFTIAARHYALVIVEDLEPGVVIEYDVRVNGERVWPAAGSEMPPSVIRTRRSPARKSPAGDAAEAQTTPTHTSSVLLGSCRAAAPHEPPYTLELAFDDEGRGVDSLWAHGHRMLEQEPASWPDLLLLVGDQIYADDSSPEAKRRIEKRREANGDDLEPEIVGGYEEYCWLYHEAWSPPIERWLLSVTPSAMIFDDHDMIDDWNISESWVSDTRQESWWAEHAVGGIMSYWVYQHIGNLSPDRLRSEGLLERLEQVDDGTEILRSWAERSEEFTPVPGGYRFSFTRHVDGVTVVSIDCRNGRVLERGKRRMLDVDEWEWICDQARSAEGHLVLATSLPVFVADGLHDLQVWSERVCDGAWGSRFARLGERIRRALDLEDWSAFGISYGLFVDLMEELLAADSSPLSIVVASGDIHFSYASRIDLDSGKVWQVVSSPIRNALVPPERGVIRFSISAFGRRIGAALRRSCRAPETRPGAEMVVGPFFANNMAELIYGGNRVELVIEHATPGEEGRGDLAEVARIALD